MNPNRPSSSRSSQYSDSVIQRLDKREDAEDDHASLFSIGGTLPPLSLRRKSHPIIPATQRAGARAKRSSLSSFASLPEDMQVDFEEPSGSESSPSRLRRRFLRLPLLAVSPQLDEHQPAEAFTQSLTSLCASQRSLSRPPHRRAQSTPSIIPVSEQDDSVKFAERRRKAVRELLETEKTYLHVLNEVEEHYLRPIRSASICAEKVIREIFGNLIEVMHIARQMSERLEGSKDRPGAAMRPIAPFLKALSLFLLNFEQSQIRIGSESLTNTAFLHLCQSCRERGVGKGLGLPSMLLVVPQRIPRYILLLQNILCCTPPTHSDRSDLEATLRIIEDIAVQNNEMIREHEDDLLLVELQRSFLSLEFALVEPGRRFLRQGRASSLLKGGGEERAMFLFSDMILLATLAKSAWSRSVSVISSLNDMAMNGSLKASASILSTKTSAGTFQYALEHRIELFEVDVWADGVCELGLSTSQIRLAVSFNNQDDRNAWLSAIRAAKQEHLASRASMRKTGLAIQSFAASDAIHRRRLSLPALDVNPHDLFKPLSPTFSRLSITSSSSGTSSTFHASPTRQTIDLPTLLSYLPPVWTPDSASTKCQICQVDFAFFYRRHHCDLCGRLLCGRCSSKRFLVSTDKPHSPPHRACTPCFDGIFSVEG